MATRQHTSVRAFIKQHAVLTFYILVFALLWGPTLIIGGPGAFMIPVRGPEAFSEGTRTKLVLDIASAPEAIPKANPFLRRVSSENPRISCYIGESLWRQRMGE